jgi:hypothetical protein
VTASICDVRFAGKSGLSIAAAEFPLWADFVAEVI